MLLRWWYATAAICAYFLVVLDLIHPCQVLQVVHIPNVFSQASVDIIDLCAELLEPYLIRG